MNTPSTLSSESQVLITLLAQHEMWKTSGRQDEMEHDNGLCVIAYPTAAEALGALYARRDGVYLNIPKDEHHLLIEDHFKPCFKAVRKIEEEEANEASERLLKNLQEEILLATV